MTTEDIYPQQDYSHSLREIAVHRDQSLELVRELISNAVDATASQIMLVPYFQKKGLVFFDNGTGLSQKTEATDISPYVAFFSIGRSTKLKDAGIGYKCQGSKLCFASARFSLLTRCDGEEEWRFLQLVNPKTQLNTKCPITPGKTSTPWHILQTHVFSAPDARTQVILDQFGEAFFKSTFNHGTLIVVEDFDAADYAHAFAEGTETTSRLYNYIRFCTAVGDTRRIKKSQGFSESTVDVVTSHIKSVAHPIVSLPMVDDAGMVVMRQVPLGYPYLDVAVTETQPKTPANINRLRDGTFYARSARATRHDGSIYTFVLAVDGRRRALTGYPSLGRAGRNGTRCGIMLTTQQGTHLSAQGIKICAFDRIFKKKVLSDYQVLGTRTEHHHLVIDGPFALVTNRNYPAEDALRVLDDDSFLEKLKKFLDDARSASQVFKEMLGKLNRERTLELEDQYHERMRDIKEDLPNRLRFKVNIKEHKTFERHLFFEPQEGEEHFVGALYTLFAHLVPKDHLLSQHWLRPLTFRAHGIDSVACREDEVSIDKMKYLEYKQFFTPAVEFNHPLTITETVVCWDFDDESCKIGEFVEDIFDWRGQITSFVRADSVDTEPPIGFLVSKFVKKGEITEKEHTTTILSLKRLLEASFEVEYVTGTAGRSVRKKRHAKPNDAASARKASKPRSGVAKEKKKAEKGG